MCRHGTCAAGQSSTFGASGLTSAAGFAAGSGAGLGLGLGVGFGLGEGVGLGFGLGDCKQSGKPQPSNCGHAMPVLTESTCT